MANTFKNKQSVNVGTSTVSMYTVPSSTTTTLIGLTLANVSGASITATVAVTDTSASTTANIIKNAPIPVGSSLEFVDEVTLTHSFNDRVEMK